MFLQENLAIQIIKDRRTESDNFRTDFGFNVLDVFNVKQQTITKIIKDAFEGEDTRTEYNVLSFSVDLYLKEYKLDEFNHNDRNIDYEIQRQKAIEKELGCKFIRINPGEDNFNEGKAINEIYRHIKKSTKKSSIDDLSKRLLELEFKLNHSIKSKVLKHVVKKNIAIIIKHPSLLFKL